MATPQPIQAGRIFTEREVALLLRVRSVKRLFRSGELQYFTPTPGAFRVTEAALVHYIARNARPEAASLPRDPLDRFISAQVKAILDAMVKEGLLSVKL